MSNESCEEGLKIYVTSRGGQYVKAEELLASSEVREIIKKMAQIPVERKSSDTSPKGREAIALYIENMEADPIAIRVNALQDQVAELRQENRELRDMMRELKPGAFTEEVVKLKIDWCQVRFVVEAAASELNWNVEISIDTAENLIVVVVPEDQDDSIVETEFDFYESVMGQLSQDVFKAINFLFVSDSD